MNAFCSAGVVVRLLLVRELRVLSDSWRSVIGSAVMFSTLLTLSAGYFMPQMGMSELFIMPLFFGSFFTSCFSLGYSCAIELAYDLRSPRLITYYGMLPVPFSVIWGGQLLVVMLRIAIVSIPVFISGLCIIGRWEVLHIAPTAAVAILFLAIQWHALLFLVVAYACSMPVLLGNLWPRFLSPLFAFGCVMYPWRAISEKAPLFSYIMLANPATYAIEGIRSAFLGGHYFLPVHYCIGVLCVVNTLLGFMLWHVMVRAVNPVISVRGIV